MLRLSQHRATIHTLAQKWQAVFLFGLLLLFMRATPVLAQSLGLEIAWFTMDGGGGTSRGAAYAIRGTAGQPDASTATGGNYRLTSGFWTVSEDQPEKMKKNIYLPLVTTGP